MNISSFRHVLPSRVREVLRQRLPEAALQWLSSKAIKASNASTKAIKASNASTKADAAVKVARTLLLKKDFETAELVINEAIQLHQGDPRLVQELAEIATARKIWPEAIKRWQAVMELWGNRSPPDAYLGLARAYDHHDGVNAAEFILRQGIAANPRNTSLSRELARILKRRPRQRVRDLADYMFSGFADPSIAELEQIRRSPKSHQVDRAEAGWALSRYFASQGCWEQSLDKLLFCICVAPTNWPLRASALQVLTAECLIQLGFTDEAEERLSDHANCLRSSPSASYVHLANSYLMLANAKAAKPDWRHSQFETDHPLYWVNLIYKTFGLTTLEPVDPRLPLCLSNISGSKTRDLSTICNHQETTVSVIVPAHNAEETIRCTISSLLSQSWINLEIVVVDDASSDRTYGIASEMALLDERIKVVQHPENRGAYAARNTGLAKATGSVVTTLDSDDYAHPDLIKAAMEVFQERPSVLAATTHWARVTQDLRFKTRPMRDRDGLGPVHKNFSSIFVRRSLVELLGGWDAVRMNGDAELMRRIEYATEPNQRGEILPGVPLTLALSRSNSLTSCDKTGIRSLYYGVREEYRQAANDHLERYKHTGDYRLHRKSVKYPFAVPHLMVSTQRSRIMYDLVLISDFSRPGGTTSCNENYIKAAVENGRSVGLIHWPRFDLKRCDLNAKIRALLRHQNVHRVVPGEEISSKLTIIHHPPILRYFPDWLERHDHESLIVLVNQLPCQWRDHIQTQYDVELTQSKLERLYGSRPYWYGISPPVTELLKKWGPGLIAEDVWYPLLDLAEWTPTPRSRGRKRVPIVGRHSRDCMTKWPENECDLRNAFLADSEYDIRILGGADKALQTLEHKPSNWTVYAFDEISVIDFLRDLDFFVHFTHSQYYEEFGRNIMEAMAIGIPVILPKSFGWFESIYGNAATYANSDGVAAVISNMWQDDELYRSKVKAGRDFVLQHCSLSEFPSRYRKALEKGRQTYHPHQVGANDRKSFSQ